MRKLAVVVALIGAFGCSTAKETASDGAKAATGRNWDAAVYHYLQAVTEDPDNIEYQMQLARARQKAAQQHLAKGVAMRELGRLHSARDELQMAVQLDPSNQYSEQMLAGVQEEIEILSGPGGANALAEMKRRASEAKVKPPILDPTSNEPITLRFPQPKPVKEIYSALGKAYGFNVLFDPKLKDDKLSVELNDVNAERALEIVLQAAGHFYKVLDEHSIIVAEDSPQNRREYEDLVIKTFFLSNAEVKDVDKLLRALIEARRLATNEQLNAITLRDTADKVAIAEKLIQVNDKAKAEVLVDVEILIMTANKDSDLGMTLSTYSFTLGVDTGAIVEGTNGSLPLDMLDGINSSNTFINIPSLVINLAKSSGKAEVLAQPQLRITDGEKAKLHIGDKVPIPVTSFNTGNAGVGGVVVPITSFQYQDIGIKIEVEPRVHHNREITLNLSVEISNVGETVTVGPGQDAVTIGTRTITSVNRLKDGETTLLAGLFRKDQTESTIETPGLSKIPILGRLFTNEAKTVKRTDLLLTITPHIVRFPDIKDDDLAPMWVGTESQISYYGSNRPRVASGRGSTGPFDSSAERRRQRTEQESEETRRSTGFHTRESAGRAQPRQVQPTPAEPQGGVELVPGVDKAGETALEDSNGEEIETPAAVDLATKPIEAELDPSATPVLIGLQPSVASIGVGQTMTLSVVSTGEYDGYRVPFDVSFDATKVAVDEVLIADGVAALDQAIDNEGGVVHLELVVPEGGLVPQTVARLKVRGVGPGPSPLSFSSGGAVVGEGVRVGVSASDGAMFVAEGAKGFGGS